MAYSELIKNFDRIRDYMRAFHVYGFKSREEYNGRSARSYDNEKRRIESYLGEYMGFRRTASGKNVFLSVDCRSAAHNPLYKALKAKSFTDGDITLHFFLMDVLADGQWHTLREISWKIDGDYLSQADAPMILDESTLRKKLKEYVEIGLIESRKDGKTLQYALSEARCGDEWADAVGFFSELSSLGAVGNFILDTLPEQQELFSFKHHYITCAIESGALCTLLDAISGKRRVKFENVSNSGRRTFHEVVPMMIFHGAQNGRQHLLAFEPDRNDFFSFRLDYIYSLKVLETDSTYDVLRAEFEEMRRHMWGISASRGGTLERVAFTLRYENWEKYIPGRLEREKRCGRVTQPGKNLCRFEAEVYDSNEMVPWIRTFIGRIVELEMDNEAVKKRLLEDLEEMYRIYGMEDGE